MSKSGRIVTIIILTFIGCLIYTVYSIDSTETNTAIENRYNDVAAVIVEMNGNVQSLTQNKFRTPQLCNAVLIKLTQHENQYAQLNSCKLNHRGIRIDAEWMYNHDIGDTIHFGFISKKRFFQINK